MVLVALSLGIFSSLAAIVDRRARVRTIFEWIAIAALAISLIFAPLMTNWQPPLIVLSLVLAVLGGGPFVELVFRIAFKNEPESVSDAPTLGLSLPASAWIGVAERFIFTLALLLNLSDVAAVVLGVKALGQYSLNSNHDAARRVLGTLLSVGWATSVFAVVYISGLNA